MLGPHGFLTADSWPPKSDKTRYYLHDKFGISRKPPESAIALPVVKQKL
jgi:hypothetical protein